MKIDKLQLNYEAHMVGCDGEMFYYSIYFENDATDENCNEVDNAVDKACDEFGEDYIGYIDITTLYQYIMTRVMWKIAIQQ